MKYSIINLEIMLNNISEKFNLDKNLLKNILLKLNCDFKNLESKKQNLKLAKDLNDNKFFLLSNICKTNYYAVKILNKI